jgi:FKBP-type peptidyl-prolyl cis-trans isomerase FkpA
MTARSALAPLALAFALAFAGCPAQEGEKKEDAAAEKPADAAAQTSDADAFYAFGASLARYASGVKVNDSDVAAIQQGLADALQGKPLKHDPRTMGPALQKLITDRRKAASDEEKAAAVGFLAEAASQTGAKKTDSGLVIQTITEGTGASPKPTDRVKVHYKGTLRNGVEFDSSISRGEPATFPLNRVVPCWTEGVGLMKVGGKAKLTCPSELAYGERGVPGRIPAGAPLVFEVELIEILPEVAEADPGAAKNPAPAKNPAAAAKPAEKPAAKPADKPAEKPAEKPAQ